MNYNSIQNIQHKKRKYDNFTSGNFEKNSHKQTLNPIIRENNGLALSSRNYSLSKEGRIAAANIYKALQLGRNLLISGECNAQKIREEITQAIIQEDILQIDYVSVADTNTLIEISGEIPNDILVSTAVLIENIRLIDNFSYSISPKK